PAAAPSVQLDIAERQGGRVFDGFESETGAHVQKLHRRDEALVHNVVRVDIGDDDAHEIVDVTAHAMDLRHFRYVAHHAHELLEPFLTVIGGLERHEYRRADVQRACIEQRHRLFDDAVLLELLDTAPAGGLGEADAVRN